MLTALEVERHGAERLLRTLWLDMRNDAAARGMAFARGAIAGAHAAGAITDEQRELWERRIATCPGHDDEGGRRWCAYCGGLEPSADGGEG